MSVFTAGDNSRQAGIHGNSAEYRQGPYIFQNMKDPLADYQQTNGFRSGVGNDMMPNKTKDKKLTFIEPLS